MRIAIPVVQDRLAMHFGHCEELALIDVDEGKGTVLGREAAKAPDHVPGLLPRWLHDLGADLIIAGGMGRRAQQLFAENDVKVVVGAPSESPEAIVEKYLAGDLQTGDNLCDH